MQNVLRELREIRDRDRGVRVDHIQIDVVAVGKHSPYLARERLLHATRCVETPIGLIFVHMPMVMDLNLTVAGVHHILVQTMETNDMSFVETKFRPLGLWQSQQCRDHGRFMFLGESDVHAFFCCWFFLVVVCSCV